MKNAQLKISIRNSEFLENDGLNRILKDCTVQFEIYYTRTWLFELKQISNFDALYVIVQIIVQLN